MRPTVWSRSEATRPLTRRWSATWIRRTRPITRLPAPGPSPRGRIWWTRHSMFTGDSATLGGSAVHRLGDRLGNGGHDELARGLEVCQGVLLPPVAPPQLRGKDDDRRV